LGNPCGPMRMDLCCFRHASGTRTELLLQTCTTRRTRVSYIAATEGCQQESCPRRFTTQGTMIASLSIASLFIAARASPSDLTFSPQQFVIVKGRHLIQMDGVERSPHRCVSARRWNPAQLHTPRPSGPSSDCEFPTVRGRTARACLHSADRPNAPSTILLPDQSCA
jgi:hypothetical protein